MFHLVPACTDTEVEASVRDDIDGSSDVGKDSRMTVSIAGHHKAKAQTLGASSKRSQESPALQLWASRIGAERDEVVKGPGVFDAWNAIRFEPDAEYAFIRSVLLRSFYTEAQVLFCWHMSSFLLTCFPTG